jgi:hypothetical protein
MKYLYKILLLLLVFEQTIQAFANTAVKIDIQTESCIVADIENYHNKCILNYEIARTCYFAGNFVSYWESDCKVSAKEVSKPKTVLILKLSKHPYFKKKLIEFYAIIRQYSQKNTESLPYLGLYNELFAEDLKEL